MTAREVRPRGSRAAPVVWARAIPMILLVTGCWPRSTPSAGPWSNPPGSACATRVVADVAQNVMEIFPTSEGVYGLTTRDAAFRVLPATDGGPGLVKMVSDIPRDNPHRLVVRGGKPVWISFLTLVGADEDGGHRQTLAKDVWSAAVGPRALYFSATEGLYAIDWPASTSARLVAPVGVQSTELVVADPWILGRSQTTGMWAYNLDTGKPHDFDPCPDRKCRGGGARSVVERRPDGRKLARGPG